MTTKKKEQCTIPVVRRSFWNEFKYPLDKVQRPWLRRFALIGLTPAIIIAGILYGFIEMYNDCW